MAVFYWLLIKQYKNSIYSYALYMLKNRMDADDVTQEVLIRIWKHDDRFNIGAARTWIMKTTHNLCIDCLRKRARMQNREYECNAELEETIADETPESDPSQNTDTRLLGETVRTAIEKLPENLRSVFVLYEIQGLKYVEISETLNMPVNSVKVYLMRARIKLQIELQKYAPEGGRT